MSSQEDKAKHSKRIKVKQNKNRKSSKNREDYGEGYYGRESDEYKFTKYKKYSYDDIDYYVN